MGAASELRKQIESALAGRIPAALSPRPRSAPELLSCGLPEVDAMLGGGLPLGAIAELTGVHSCGRTTLALATLAALTGQGESCAYVDVCDTLDPLSAATLGVDLRRLLWIRPAVHPATPQSPPETENRRKAATRLEQGLRATDLLLNAGGFRAVVFDLGEIAPGQARRVPLATWYRFRLQAEKSRTLLLLITEAAQASQQDPEGNAQDSPRNRAQGHAQNCAAVGLHFLPAQPNWRQAAPLSPRLLASMEYRLTLGRSVDSTRKKPVASAPASVNPAPTEAAWSSTTPWAG